jgi:hypothetical protein
MSLISKIRASGSYADQTMQVHKPARLLTRKGVDVKKGTGRAFVARKGMPVNFKPTGAPRRDT